MELLAESPIFNAVAKMFNDTRGGGFR